MRDLPFSSTITRDEAALLLQLSGLSLLEGSPLADLLESPGAQRPPEAVLADLSSAGWLERANPPTPQPRVLEAFEVLARPCRRLRVTMGSAEGLARFEVFGGDGGDWVRFEPERSGIWARLEFPLEPMALLDRVQRAFDLNTGFLMPRFRGSHPWPTFVVLLGLLDTYRATCLQAILQRSDVTDPTVSADAVLTAIKTGLKKPHCYWAVSLGSLVAPAEIDITRAHVEGILEDLAGQGHLSRVSPNVYRYGRSLQELAVSLLLVPAFLGLSLERRDGPPAHLAALRGSNSLWLIAFHPNVDGSYSVSLAPTQPPEFLARVQGLLEAGASVSHPPVTPQPAFADAAPSAPSEIMAANVPSNADVLRASMPSPPEPSGPSGATAGPGMEPLSQADTRRASLESGPTGRAPGRPDASTPTPPTTPTQIICPACGRSTRRGRFCTLCGTALGGATVPPPGGAP